MIQLLAYTQGTDINGGGTLPITELDLFDNEPIPLSLSVDNFINVAEKSAGYSQVFKIPGTKNNNKFFTHVYEITADSVFNSHKVTNIILKENSSDIFNGYMQLNDIIDKDGTIMYSITLFAQAVNLKDLLSAKIMRDLDLSELNHNYTKSNIKDSWTSGINLINNLSADSLAGSGSTTTVLKYPFIRWNTNSSYNSGTNIVSFPLKYDCFRPFLQIKYLIELILRGAGYTVTSNFFNTTAFNKLFTDLHRGFGGNVMEGIGAQFNTSNSIDITYNSTSSVLIQNTVINSSQFGIIDGNNFYDTTTNIFTATDNALVGIDTYFTVASISGGGNSVITVGVYVNNIFSAYLFVGLVFAGSTINSTITLFPNAGDEIEVRITASTNLTLDSSSYSTWTVSSTTQFLNDNLQGYKGDFNQWEFFKGIVDMYQLLIMPDTNNPTNVIIEPYNDWVDNGSLLDWSNKVDIKDIKLNPISNLSQRLQFRLKEDTPDWITKNHNYPNNWKYSYNQVNDIEIFSKDKEVIEVSSFSSTAFGNVLGGEFLIPCINNEEANLVAWPNNWRILYDNGVKTLPTTTYTSYQFTSEDTYLQFSPVSEVPKLSTSTSTDFGVVSYTGIGAVLNGLYNIYWAKYIDELYHKDTKILKILANINSSDIEKLAFNDIIFIKNRKYRLLKIDYRAGALSKLELITIKDL